MQTGKYPNLGRLPEYIKEHEYLKQNLAKYRAAEFEPSYQGHADQHCGHVVYSQNGEDIIIRGIFNLLNIEKPSYLDLGAHHPFNISNTAIFYKAGSRGVNVDANARMIDEYFHWDRHEDKNVACAVAPHAGEYVFYMYDDYSGRNTLSSEEVASVQSKYPQMRKDVEKKLVKAKTINDMVREYCDGKFPDFLNCDLEGLDFEVLQSADFDKLGRPIVICVECHRESVNKIGHLLLNRGYFKYIRTGENCIFVDRESWLKIQMLG